jgi:hypothetical protein
MERFVMQSKDRVNSLEFLMGRKIYSRQFAVTQKGYMALVPLGTQEGDWVAVVVSIGVNAAVAVMGWLSIGEVVLDAAEGVDSVIAPISLRLGIRGQHLTSPVKRCYFPFPHIGKVP